MTNRPGYRHPYGSRRIPVSRPHGKRRFDATLWMTLVPVVALVPGWLLAMLLFWLPVRAWKPIPFWMFATGYLALGLLLFFRPFQRIVLTRILGARRPTPYEREVLDPVWTSVTKAIRSHPRRYVLAVLDADDLNAYACGGHLVVVTSAAVSVLPPRELAGVVAHELSHHLGLHTVALTVRHWLGLPVLLLARIGFFLEHVAQAATQSFSHRSTGLTLLGPIITFVLRIVAWLFLVTILVSNALSNLLGRRTEFEADRRTVELGFGPALAAALRRFISMGLAGHPTRWRDRAFASHPSARLRVARIEAQLRLQHPSRS
jgi:Zn-dependent protease with chaperone function